MCSVESFYVKITWKLLKFDIHVLISPCFQNDILRLLRVNNIEWMQQNSRFFIKKIIQTDMIHLCFRAFRIITYLRIPFHSISMTYSFGNVNQCTNLTFDITTVDCDFKINIVLLGTRTNLRVYVVVTFQ